MTKIIPVVIAVIVAITLVAVVTDFSSPNPEKLDLFYDDYVEISQPCEGSDIIEVVEVQGKFYLHAIGVGDTSITIAGDSLPVTVKKADLDVFLITGQSNSGNYDYDQFETVTPPLGSSYYYGTYRALCYPNYQIATYDPSLCDMRPITSDALNVPVIADKSTVFAKNYYEQTGHKVYWICGGIGGKSVTWFSPTYGSGEIYPYEQQLLDDALGCVNTDFYNIHIKDYIWIQGETDKTLSINTYKECFTEWNTALTSDSSFYESMENWPEGQFFKNCYISLIPSEYTNSYKAQLELASEIENVTISTKIANTFTIQNGMLNSGDGIHYTQKGDNVIAKYLATSAASNVYDKNPVIKQIEWENGVEWDLLAILPILIIVGVITSIIGMLIIKGGPKGSPSLFSHFFD